MEGIPDPGHKGRVRAGIPGCGSEKDHKSQRPNRQDWASEGLWGHTARQGISTQGCRRCRFGAGGKSNMPRT